MTRHEEWIGGSITVPAFVTDEDRAPFRPEAFLWINGAGEIVGNTIFSAAAVEEVGPFFRQTTKAPLVGRPRVPRRVRVASAEVADALRAVVGRQTDVVCAPTPEVDVVLASLADYLGKKLGSSAWTYATAGIEAAGAAGLHRAAARLYRSRPWDVVSVDESLVSVSIEELGLRSCPLSIIGQNRESFGFVLFPDLDAYDAYGDMDGLHDDEPPIPPPHRSLTFDPRDEVDRHIRRELEANRWEIAGPEAYPLVAIVDDDGLPRPPTAADVAALEALSTALAIAVENGLVGPYGEETVDRTLTIDTVRGPARVRIIAPLEADDALGFALDRHVRAGHELDEEAASAFGADLERRFARSVAAGALGGELRWPGVVLELARFHLGATVTDLGAGLLAEILLDVLPVKVVAEPRDAGRIVAELRVFFAWLAREHGVVRAAACERILGDELTEDLRHALADRSRFGIAKSWLLAGRDAGFDVQSQEGLENWMRVSQGAQRGLEHLAALGSKKKPSPTAAAKKKKRKAERVGRRKNR
jgi:hypothetical protein